jgi:hypothetical protein
MSNTTLGTVTLHDGTNAVIKSNTCKKEAIMVTMPLYLSDSDQTDVLDFGGVTKNITLSGDYVGADLATCKTWIDSLEDLIQGHQDVQAGYPLTFTDDLRGTIKVKVMSFESVLVEAETIRISWTLVLVESSTNA